ncbi:MAG: M23 family metallopeptidase [Pseudomonadota bacterium]
MASAGILFVVLLIWSIGLTGYVFFKDDVVRTLMRQHAMTVENYETEMTGLRLRVDSLRAKQFLNQDQFTGALDTLATRQTDLEERQGRILAIVERARQASIEPEAVPGRPKASDRAALDKLDHSVTLAGSVSGGVDPVSRPAMLAHEALSVDTLPSSTATRNLRQIEAQVTNLADNQATLLNSIERASQKRVENVERLFTRIRMPKSRFVRGGDLQTGGPFIPLDGDAAQDPLDLQVARIDQQIGYLDQLQDVIDTIPVRRPITTKARMSSRFGPRIDPFLGRRAFHSGLDFAAPRGTRLSAPAAGRIIRAGRMGGYGRTVEIDHGNGITTRYAHMNRISVKRGQRVSPGQKIGTVGSTGRSTGPHLHYEVRIDGKAVDPMRFVTAL